MDPGQRCALHRLVRRERMPAASIQKRTRGLWLVSRSRVERLTDRETVRLRRVLIEASSKALRPEVGLRESSVWFPDAPRATIVIRDYAGQSGVQALNAGWLPACGSA
jgi:hypothetical protein